MSYADKVEQSRTEAIMECGEALLNDYHPRIQRLGHAVDDLSTGSMGELEARWPELWAAVTDLVEFYDYGSEPTEVPPI